MSRKTTKTIVAEIALYGNYQIGAGYLVSLADGRMLGDGEPRPNRSMNDAVWLACLDVQDAGIRRGKVRVFTVGGEWMAETEVSNPPYFGDLDWQPAPVITISYEAIMAVAERD